MNDLVIECYDNRNAHQYIKLLNDRGLQLDIYYQTEFLEIESSIQKGKYEIFTAKISNEIFIYPYIKLPFQGKFSKYVDIISPYGYCGPYCSNHDLFPVFENAFLSYAGDSSFVTEFVRYHFLYNRDHKFGINIQNEQNRFIITLDLNKTWDNIWMSEMSVTNRNIVRKLEKEQYSVEVKASSDHLEEFIEMYNKTMLNVKAQDFYFFDKTVYYLLFEKLKGKIIIARVIKNGVTQASALFLLSGKIITYYLSARNLSYPNIPASNLLLTEVIRYACDHKYDWFNFGGGRTNSKEDALFKFKNNFSKRIEEFYIGKRIHRPDIYERLSEDYIDKHGEIQYHSVKQILQFYRV